MGSIPISRREGVLYKGSTSILRIGSSGSSPDISIRAQARRNILSPLISASATFFADEVWKASHAHETG